jgi:NADPH:quinone reductase-like Zn-dependent oxidoreductase
MGSGGLPPWFALSYKWKMPNALQISRFGGPEVLKIVDVPAQELPPNGVRIAVRAAGVNFADLMMRMGMYPEAPKPPFVPGYEVSGQVTGVGSQVTGFRPGDRVLAGSKFGGYTSEIVLPDYQVRKTPASLSDAEAATIPVNFMTAWVALEDMARVRAGDRVLIHSAAGGVGVAAVQIAARAGAHVVGLVGSPSKADVVKSLGAHEVWTNEKWETGEDKDLGGFDIVLDATGGKSLKTGFRRLAPAGRIVNFGVASMVGEKRSLAKVVSTFVNTPLFTPFKLMMHNKGVYGLNMLQLFEPPVDGRETLMGRCLDRVMEGFEKGRFKAIVGKTFPLAEGGAAHEYLRSRANIGKVVLTC